MSAALALVACRPSTPAVAPVQNVGSEVSSPVFSPDLLVTPETHLGWLALAPASPHNETREYWFPTDMSSPLVVPVGQGAVWRAAVLTAVPSRGDRFEVSAAGNGTIQYGCEQNRLDVERLALVDDRTQTPAPGVAWVLPHDAPAWWRPRAITLAETLRTVDERRWSVGPLTIRVRTVAARRTQLTLAAGEEELYHRDQEWAVMDGADESPIKLGEDSPGESGPIVAFELAPGGPILVVMITHGYEGVSLWTLLAQADGARNTDLAAGLYLCAF